jgi:hypothetical protein
MDEQYVFNGIDGLTGEPLLAPMTVDEVAQLVAPERLRELAPGLDVAKSFGLGFGLDPANIVDAGWTIVFASDEAQAVRDALQPLIEHREGSGAVVRVLAAEPGEDFSAFMARHGVYPGEIEPETMGYYLMIVGSPAKIPWDFQYHANIEYAVGRLAFDSPEEYARYASSVIATETASAPQTSKHISFWGPRHDRATELSHDDLLEPLINGDGEAPEGGGRPKPAIATQLKWEASTYLGDHATKANFLRALGLGAPELRPSLLLTASHGIGNFRPGSNEQLTRQGALVAADWRGPGSIGPADYVAAEDVPDDAQLAGMIAFHFACYGAGTPLRDCFRHRDGQAPKRLAQTEFVAALPKRLLGHQNGSALAVVGHVDRAWGSSFIDKSGRHIGPFRNALGHLMTGKPVGFAVSGFNERYAVLSNNVASLLEKRGFGEEIDAKVISRAWLGRNDAQNYVVLGDPAVKLQLS